MPAPDPDVQSTDPPPAAPEAAAEELLHVVHRMLAAIHSGDAEAYGAMCAPELSCFETDVAPYRIDGVDFHLNLIDAMAATGTYSSLVRFDVLTPHVQVYGDTGIVTYTRLMTYAGPRWAAFNETRVFVRREGLWRMVHFHRSHAAWPPTPAQP